MRLTSWMTGAWSSRLTSAATAAALLLVVGDLERGDEAARCRRRRGRCESMKVRTVAGSAMKYSDRPLGCGLDGRLARRRRVGERARSACRPRRRRRPRSACGRPSRRGTPLTSSEISMPFVSTAGTPVTAAMARPARRGRRRNGHHDVGERQQVAVRPTIAWPGSRR